MPVAVGARGDTVLDVGRVELARRVVGGGGGELGGRAVGVVDALEERGQRLEAFLHAFETGDEVFGTTFEARDGVGAKVGNGQQFTRVPRADLAGPGEWGTHTPSRPTGPNGQSCAECHNLPAVGGMSVMTEVRAGYVDEDGTFTPLYGDTLYQLFSVPPHRCQVEIPVEANVIARRAPIPLFGAGLVEAIADETILANEDPADADGGGISGRAARMFIS